jgi:hypothetical protein
MSSILTKILGLDPRSKSNPKPTVESTVTSTSLQGDTAMAATATKEKQPQEVLTFFLNPSNKYMGHFFHLKEDTPVMEAETKTSRDGIKKEKVTFKTKKDRLYLSDVDTIIKKHTDLKGKRSYEDISLGILSTTLLDLMEAQHLSIDKVIGWAKQEASAKIAMAPRVTKAKAPVEKADPLVRFLIKSLNTLAPRIGVSDLKALLQETVNDDAKLLKATTFLEGKLKDLGRDENGFIRLRNR